MSCDAGRPGRCAGPRPAATGPVVDAAPGSIVLRTAVDAAGHTQAARIGGAVFDVRQPKDGTPCASGAGHSCFARDAR